MISPRQLLQYFTPTKVKITGVQKANNTSKLVKEFTSIVGMFDEIEILWYPSAGNDLKDIALFYTEKAHDLELKTDKPIIFIHTDFSYNHEFKLDVGEVFETHILNEKIILEIVDSSTLFLTDTPYVNPSYVGGRNNEMDGSARLVKFEITDRLGKKNIAYLLYIYTENIEFFKEYIIGHDIKIEHLVTIREGSGLGGGGKITNKLFAFYLGIMECKYWYTDLMGKNIDTIRLLQESDDLLSKAYRDPFNHPTVLEGKLELKWSNYGTFKGDAHIYGVSQLTIPQQKKQYTRGVLNGLWKSSFFTKKDLKEVEKCGCFSCLKLFKPEEVMFSESMRPQCPYCSVDAVLRDSITHPLSKDLLKSMQNYYFERYI